MVAKWIGVRKPQNLSPPSRTCVVFEPPNQSPPSALSHHWQNTFDFIPTMWTASDHRLSLLQISQRTGGSSSTVLSLRYSGRMNDWIWRLGKWSSRGCYWVVYQNIWTYVSFALSERFRLHQTFFFTFKPPTSWSFISMRIVYFELINKEEILRHQLDKRLWSSALTP